MQIDLHQLPSHPRLMLSRERIAGLQSQSDSVSLGLKQCVISNAESFLAAKSARYEKEGRRLLNMSRLVLTHVASLGLAALLTGNRRYAARAIVEMKAAAEFPDWNPSHFLDTAEMTLALSLGYDWLHDWMTPAEREAISRAIIEKGLNPSFDESTGYNWWIGADNNWSQVCHGGMTAGALAIAELDPELARTIVERAISNLPVASESYRPDGAYAEGPMYWEYGTSFHVILLSMLESVFGDRFQLDETPGFLESARYIAQVTGPGGQFFNYADADAERALMPALFWFARRLGDPNVLRHDLSLAQRAFEEGHCDGAGGKVRLLPLALLWWQPALLRVQDAPLPPLDWMACGHNPVAVHRAAWGDPRATYVAIKGGTPSSNHGQMDSGSFVFETDGVRWACDLGRQEYNSLESAGIDLWNKSQESSRWGAFRLGSFSHNILLFSKSPQRVDGMGEIVRFSADPAMPHTVVELSSIYADQAATVLRGVALLPDGRILLQDEWIAREDGDVEWRMVTKANATASGNEVVLEKGDKRLALTADASIPFTIEIDDIFLPRAPFDSPNPEARMIVIRCPCRKAEPARLRVVATHKSCIGRGDTPELRLENWSKPLSGDGKWKR